MLASKRRPASTQAISRQVEGIEPRNHDQQEGRRRRNWWKSTGAQPEWPEKSGVKNRGSGLRIAIWKNRGSGLRIAIWYALTMFSQYRSEAQRA
jgi:hypothetical protein